MELSDLLFREYELVQSKLDSVGAFKFRVRGWSITVVSALTVAIATGRVPVAFLLLAVLLILFFAFLEQEQEELGLALGNRAAALELAIDRLVVSRSEPSRRAIALTKAALDGVNHAPFIGREMRRAASSRFGPLLRRALRLRRSNAFVYSQVLIVLLCAFLLIPDLRRSVTQLAPANERLLRGSDRSPLLTSPLEEPCRP